MADTCPTVRIKSKGPTGYADLDESAFDPNVHELWVDPLDHDANGKKGGSLPDSDLGDLRKQYRAKFGKNAGPKWTAADIADKLAE
jgi:hypothetical protein